MSVVTTCTRTVVAAVISTLVALTLVFGLLAAPASAAPNPVRVMCQDEAYSNLIGVEVQAMGQSHVFARYKYWNGSSWVTFRETDVTPFPQSQAHGQYFGVSSYWLPGFIQYNVGNGYFRVDVYSYFQATGWTKHPYFIYELNGVRLGTGYCGMN